MSEYIVRETGYPGTLKQEIVCELVRCADCKWLQCNMMPDGYLPSGVNEYECRHWCDGCDPTDFCSYGEKRDDEN